MIDNNLAHLEDAKRDRNWDPLERWRAVQAGIAWADSQQNPPRNSRAGCQARAARHSALEQSALEQSALEQSALEQSALDHSALEHSHQLHVTRPVSQPLTPPADAGGSDPASRRR